MRVLSLTTLYPHAGAPHHGVFVENRLAALVARGHAVRMIAPVPWFPSRAEAFGAYAVHARAPAREERRGIPVSHPRYALPPRTAMSYAPAALTRCFERAARAAIADGFAPDLIDAHYLYPDGVAAAEVARQLDLPLVLTARGTDVNLIPRYPRQKRAILSAVAQAEATICVADALRDELVRLGADPHRVVTWRNGVDLDLFSSGDRDAARRALGVGGPVIASVGHLTERKGHHLVIDALAQLPDATLLIAGTGEEHAALERQAAQAGLEDRVRLLGGVPHEALAEVYRAADVLVLASSREGWPNVLLEAMACGTPCVATPVWGSSEVVSTRAAGRLAADRSAPAIARAVGDLLADPPDRSATRAHAERHGWGPVAEGVEGVWRAAAARSAWGRAVPPRTHDRPMPDLLLTVDTEECFDWSGGEAGWHVASPDALLRLQDVAERRGVRPLYFASHPVIEDEAAGGALAELARTGRADVGLHLHAWCTPPGESAPTGPESFQCNLPPNPHAAKLAALIAAFEARFDRAPVAHRAGRYGAAPWVLDQLAEAGVTADFSPSAGFDFTAKGGPDFSRMDARVRVRTTAWGEQRVHPVSGARHWRKVKAFGARPSGLTSLPAALGAQLAMPARLSPEGVSLADMKRLAAHLAEEGATLLTPTIHSSSLEPGVTRYAPDEAGARALLERMDAFLGWALGEGCRPVSLDELTPRA